MNRFNRQPLLVSSRPWTDAQVGWVAQEAGTLLYPKQFAFVENAVETLAPTTAPSLVPLIALGVLLFLFG